VQTFDYTTLAAVTAELQAWVPAKVEAVVQQDTGTALRLRTVADTGASTAPPAAGAGSCNRG
jgi:predicted ribosome quality control (RQC) complex YloA/Tae2 family protein